MEKLKNEKYELSEENYNKLFPPKKKLSELFTDESNGITESEEYDLCNILGTHDCRHFINVLLFDKGSYSINIVKAIKAYKYLSERYVLPL